MDKERSNSSFVYSQANGNGISSNQKNHDGQLQLQPQGDLAQPQPQPQVVEYKVPHGLTGRPRVQISWGTGNHLRLGFLPTGGNDWEQQQQPKREPGKVVDVALGPEIQGGAEERRISSASLPFFAMLQSQQRRQMAGGDPASSDDITRRRALTSSSGRWETVLEYSQNISSVLEAGGSPLSNSVPDRLEDLAAKDSKPKAATRAIWDLVEIFYVDKGAESWFSERLVEWLLTHGAIFSAGDQSLKARLIDMKRDLAQTLFPEDQSLYWDSIASALAVGWLDFVVKLLRLHGSYRHDQIDDRQTENGLVEAVAVLVSKMPRLRPSLPYGEPGIAYKFKPEFAKDWERWRVQVSKLDRSAYWSECHHKGTLYGLRKLLEILQGNAEALASSTSHWIELLVANHLHVRPLSTSTEGFISLARSCIASKKGSSTSADTLQALILAIMGEDTEIVISECAKHFEPWLMAHVVDLLKVKSPHAENILQREMPMQGGMNLEELYRLSYAQALASHPLTWQLAPVYLAACPQQGLGMLEALLLKLPVSGDHRLALKALEVCRLYDLQAVAAILCRKVGVHDWKHGLKGAAIVWLQRSGDSGLLSSLSKQLLASVSTASWDGQGQEHAQALEQMEGLVDLLGSEFQASGATSGGLSFLPRYKNFKITLQNVSDMRSRGPLAPSEKQKLAEAGRQAATYLTELFKAGVTPKHFWLPLLQDSVELLEWPEHVLLNTSETNRLLNCTQELRLAKLCGDLDNVDISGPVLDRVRLALATNLSRSFIQV